jgi:chromosome segregation ATPase
MIAGGIIAAILVAATLGWMWWRYERRYIRELLDRLTQAESKAELLDRRNADLDRSQRELATERAAREDADTRFTELFDQHQAAIDERRYWKQRAEHYEEQYQQANGKAIEAVEKVADWEAQRMFGRKIFDHSPALPERANIPKPVTKGRVQARIVVQQAERQFEKALAEHNASRGNPAPPNPVRMEATNDSHPDE